MHLWRYVGYLMGVEERILPTNEQDSMRALYHLIATIGDSDDDSRRLGEALANASLQNRDGWLSKQAGKLEYALRAGFTRYILGDEAGDTLGLPRTRAKYFWPAQAPLRAGLELARMATPGANKALMWLGEKARKEQFPKQVKQLKADTTFTPVKKLFGKPFHYRIPHMADAGSSCTGLVLWRHQIAWCRPKLLFKGDL